MKKKAKTIIDKYLKNGKNEDDAKVMLGYRR